MMDIILKWKTCHVHLYLAYLLYDILQNINCGITTLHVVHINIAVIDMPFVL